MLLDDPRSSFGGAPHRRRYAVPSRRALRSIGFAAVPLFLITLQIVASRNNFEGPLETLWHDYTGVPKSFSTAWAALLLTLVGLTWRYRALVFGAAVLLDAVYAGVRVLLGGRFVLGNGPVVAITGLVLLAWLGWEGKKRADALHAAALGALLILATMVGDVWLRITVLAGPSVQDRYVVLADHAFGEPSWIMGRVLAAAPALASVLHWVYLELPFGAGLVAIWQLRNVVTSDRWPSHYIVRTFLVLGLVGPICYVLFPVVGPIFAYGSFGHQFSLGDYWPHTVPPLDHNPGSMPFDNITPRNCMPSMHTAWATSVFLHSRRAADGSLAPRWLRWLGAFWLAATLGATLGFGYHYGTDLVAGFVLCLALESALREPERGWDRTRAGLVAGGAALLAVLLLSYRYGAEWMAAHPLPAGLMAIGAVAMYARMFWATWFPAPALIGRADPVPVRS
ncbi:phosphatase PAP2 family protein [Nocardia stercoris]|uniref:Inositol phosphorylceramide synthase n=1 Tax=Nocardia stercoris TaxID=2483361 RepID=A0A3M2L9W0_9NOCA|nr:phosphatase PAP2 family protein [Nocardia stercoris]RMI34357.1 inositol phosphorylceramide synthase [Nocardia stercoris]